MFSSNTSGPGAVSDPQFNYVTMLLPGNGTNGAQNNTFLDSSTNNFTITRNGNTTQGTFTPYGANWSNYFDGSGDLLTLPDNAAFGFGTGNFTFEFWLYYTGGNGYTCFFANSGSSGNYIYYGLNSGTRQPFVWNEGNVLTTSTNVSSNTWQHHAVVRNGSTLTIYLDGVAIGSTTWNVDLGSSRPLAIGATSAGTQPTAGYISNFRIVKGAVYTANFTPPTSPLAVIANTSLLTCADNRFIDDSTNNFTITRFGDVSVQRFSPFNPTTPYAAGTIGGSGYFDGTGDFLRAPANQTALQMGAGDFTVECWIYQSATNTYPSILEIGDHLSGNGILFIASNGSTVTAYAAGDGFLGSITAPPLNTWAHIAWVRSGSTFKIYVNGVGNAGVTITRNLTDSAVVTIGGEQTGNSGYTYTGLISGLRVIKGTAVYTSNFTPPTAPPTAITNTSLLLNFTNGGIIDNAMMNDLETVGNAQISTSVSKFGGGSLAFDGSGDRLVAASTPQTIFSGSFTIEFWINFTSIPVNFIALVGGTTANTQLFITTKSNGQGIRFGLTGVAEYAAGTFTWATGNWYHIALVRNGTDVRFYVNGTNVSDSTYTNSTTYSGVLLIGGGVSGAVDFPGYIDDLRITKYARYTANFTPPSAPLPTN